MPDENRSQPDPPPHPVRLIRPLAVGVVLVVAVLGGLYLLGVTHPAKRSAITTDRLGPDSGEQVQTYLAAAAAGLDRVGPGSRWALISLRAPVDDDTAWSLMSGTGASQLAFHVPIAGVATTTTFVAVTGDRGSVETARNNAIATVAADAGDDPGTRDASASRDRQVSAVTVARLRDGCACIVAMIVRGDGPRLRAIAASPQVRGVQVLPADAAGGRFAATVLLPEQTDRVLPIDDSGAVPAR